MSVEFYTCKKCGDGFSDCSPYSDCKCGEIYCDECEGEIIDTYGKNEDGYLNQCDECNPVLLEKRERLELARLREKYEA